MTSTYAIGIDLGTTFSSVAVFKNGKPDAIANLDGEYLTPSAVFYNPESSEILVGKYAEDVGIQEKSNLIYDTKRLMGRKFDDIYVQNLIKTNEYNYKIVKGTDDSVEIEVNHNKEIVRKLPEEVASEILKYLKESAEVILGAEISEVVISVPAHFGHAQRRATREAAKLAGLKVLKLVSEPVAAAIHYSLDKFKANSTFLVFDFGGGTLDVSVIQENYENFKVCSTEGDSFLGGRDFDKRLKDHIISSAIANLEESGDIYRKHLFRINKKCVQLKKTLSIRKEARFVLDNFGNQQDDCFSMTITRDLFETLNEPLFERAVDLVTQCLVSLDFSADDIDQVLLVGGTTRIPKIRSRLASYFGEKKLRFDINPDEAIALGGAILAAVINKNVPELGKYNITEVAPLSIGIQLSGGLMKVGIRKNTSLPASGTIRTATVENYQTESYKKIFEGERKNCKFNTLLGCLTLSGLPLGLAGQVQIETVFNLDEDGILTVETWAISNGVKSQAVIELREHKLSLKNTKTSLEDIIRIKQEDEVFEKLIRYRWRSTEFCSKVLYDLDDILDDIKQNQVKEMCDSFIEYARSVEDISSFADLTRKFEALRKELEPLINGVIDVNVIVQ